MRSNHFKGTWLWNGNFAVISEIKIEQISTLAKITYLKNVDFEGILPRNCNLPWSHKPKEIEGNGARFCPMKGHWMQNYKKKYFDITWPSRSHYLSRSCDLNHYLDNYEVVVDIKLKNLKSRITSSSWNNIRDPFQGYLNSDQS